MQFWIKRNAFLLVALLLLVFETIHIVIGYWTGDFWQHAAVINELSKDLLHPRNPMIDAHVPHAFYSPYSLLVAKFAQLSQSGPIHALGFFAFLNLVFFLWSFYNFCSSVFKEQATTIGGISLFLILFLVGTALSWSGFFHFYFFHKGLPYPSTFAFAMSLFILGKLIRTGDNRNRSNTVLVIVLSGIVFITHPNTGLFLFIAIIALYSSSFNFKKATINSAIIILSALLLSALWPYYNMTDLFFGKNGDFHKDSEVLYKNVAGILWPVILCMPSLALMKHDRIVRFFITGIFLMLLMYAVGYFFRMYGLGRIISPVIIFSDFLIAYSLYVFRKQNNHVFRFYAGLVTSALVLSLSLNLNLLKRTIAYSERDTSYYSKFNALKTVVKENETIISDLRTSLFIPVFQGKVVAVKYPLYWIEDIHERRKNVESFFTNGTNDSTRHAILKKYQPDYILIDYASIKPTDDDVVFYRSLGHVIFRKGDVELIRLN